MAASFQCLPLHPGASQNCGDGIVFADPYPDDTLRPTNTFRVNIPFAQFMPLVFNRRDWNTAFSAEIVVEAVTVVFGSRTTTMTASASGKYIYSHMAWRLDTDFGYPNNFARLIIKGTNREPINSISGACDSRTYIYDADWGFGTPNPAIISDATDNAATGVWLMPGTTVISYRRTQNAPLFPDPPFSDASYLTYPDHAAATLTVNDASAVESGDMALSIDLNEPPNTYPFYFSQAGARVIVVQAWVKTDGTVDLFVEVDASLYPSAYDLAPFEGVGLKSQAVVNVVDVSWGIGTSTISLFGVNVTGYWQYTGPPGLAGLVDYPTITSAAISYNVTPSALWTY